MAKQERTVSREGTLCQVCKKGFYFEGCLHDDWHGMLTCNNDKCGTRVEKWVAKNLDDSRNGIGADLSVIN